MRIEAHIRIALIVFLGLMTTPVRGDGKFFAKPGFPQPTIPGQRAAIVLDGAIETMVVDTQLIADSGDVAWIIPTPAPAEVFAVPRGVMETLDLATGPAFVPRPISRTTLVTSLCLGLFALGWLLLPGRAGLVSLSLLAWLAVVTLMMSSALGRARGSAAKSRGADVEVVSKGLAGDFEFTVMRGEDAGAIVAWLRDAGFSVPDAAVPVFESHVAEGWSFAAGRLTPEARAAAHGGTQGSTDWRPHPVALRFPTTTPVYPMRLTGVGEAEVSLRIHVLADAPVNCNVLDQAAILPIERRSPNDAPLADLPPNACSLGLPALLSLAPTASFVTRLEGTLLPAHLDSDLRFERDRSAIPRRELQWRILDRREEAWVAGVAVVVAVTLFGGVVGAWRKTRGRTRWATVWGVAALVLGTATGFMLHAKEARREQDRRLTVAMRAHEAHAQAVTQLVRGATISPELVATLRNVLNGHNLVNFNPFTATPLREEASPGNWLVVHVDERVEYRWFDVAGTPHAMVVAAASDGSAK